MKKKFILSNYVPQKQVLFWSGKKKKKEVLPSFPNPATLYGFSPISRASRKAPSIGSHTSYFFSVHLPFSEKSRNFFWIYIQIHQGINKISTYYPKPPEMHNN